jgi:outer membrane protein OmpA-like peptidoglycan-associated protein
MKNLIKVLTIIKPRERRCKSNRKRSFLLTAVLAAAIVLGAAGCETIPNPETKPVLKVITPSEPWTPDPDKANETLTLFLEREHKAPIAEWNVKVRPVRQSGEGPLFYEHTFNQDMPDKVVWTWNAKSNAPDRQGEMVQSATDYRVILTSTDSFGNTATEEGILSIGIIVRRDDSGDLRMVVSNIAFPPDSANLNLVSADQKTANERVLRFVGRALNKYADYTITIEGHTNPTTAPNTQARAAEDKEPLSGQRAQAVLDWLVTNSSVDSGRMKAVGMGGTVNVAPWDDPNQNERNRRVEFILHK